MPILKMGPGKAPERTSTVFRTHVPGWAARHTAARALGSPARVSPARALALGPPPSTATPGPSPDLVLLSCDPRKNEASAPSWPPQSPRPQWLPPWLSSGNSPNQVSEREPPGSASPGLDSGVSVQGRQGPCSWG